MTDSVVYHSGPHNEMNDTEQWIRITDGCPNQCEYCYAPKEFQYHGIPEIERSVLKIMDMNLLAHPEAEVILSRLSNSCSEKELICGIDWRYLDDRKARLLKAADFKRIRLAWDGIFGRQKEIKRAIEMLSRVGYQKRDLMLFIICNWKIPYEENLKKLDLCKVWNVKVADCWFDNQISPNIKPIHWTLEQIKDFRHRVRKHNQMVLFGIDPELKVGGVR
jgi:hypothetical protein